MNEDMMTEAERAFDCSRWTDGLLGKRGKGVFHIHTLGCQMNVHVRDGKIVKTSRRKQSDPDVTRVCNKGLTHALRVYAEDRLKYPMKRVGKRGEGKFERISWDEAWIPSVIIFGGS